MVDSQMAASVFRFVPEGRTRTTSGQVQNKSRRQQRQLVTSAPSLDHTVGYLISRNSLSTFTASSPEHQAASAVVNM